jgi:hypothetical protein
MKFPVLTGQDSPTGVNLGGINDIIYDTIQAWGMWKKFWQKWPNLRTTSVMTI